MSVNFRLTYKLVASCLLIYGSFYVKEIIPRSPDNINLEDTKATSQAELYGFTPLEIVLDTTSNHQEGDSYIMEDPSLSVSSSRHTYAIPPIIFFHVRFNYRISADLP